MDSVSLVGHQIDNGGRLIEGLTESGFNVTAAAWIRVPESSRWLLYIVSNDINSKGPIAAYRTVADSIRRGSDSGLSIPEIKLLAEAMRLPAK
jgi:hypothetical protein